MRVLAGGPARETGSDLFRLHVDGLEAQEWVEVVHEVVAPESDPAAEFVGGESRWPLTQVERVAQCRQRFMERVGHNACVKATSRLPGDPVWKSVPRLMSYGNYDAVLMVDTDVILGPGVLDRLWAVDADVVYGVFWSVWPGGRVPLPQVWDIHPYGHTQALQEALVAGGEVEVLGGGACTLFRGRAFESRYWPLLEGLKRSGGAWAGEDRTFCLGLECRGIRQVAVAGLPIVHLYRPEQQTPEALAEARRMVGLSVTSTQGA